jgi:transcription elongation GreA/GreB family factor
MQAVLMLRKAELEAEISQARGTDFADADTSVVSLGTIVDMEDSSTGEKETFTILGAWDTNLDEGIISYLSETAAALLGKAPGAEAEIATEAKGISRKVTIKSVRAVPPMKVATPGE